LQIVDKFDQYRYFLAEGGRGGGKSQGIARLLLYLAEHYKLRITCGREIQKNIEESVYTIFVDIIREFNLDFMVYANKLVHNTTRTTINFKGFREQGMVNIKGLEGVDILWIDESQAITKNTLDVIIPTIRKQKSKVFFTMNRYLESDAVYREFVDREDCLHININYMDNPFISDALLKEAELCKEKDLDDFNHIWMGIPLASADNFLFNERELNQDIDFVGCGYHEVFAGFDIARYGGDKCVAKILQRRGPIKFEEKHTERWAKTDLMQTTGRIVDILSRFKPNSTSIDGDGMGAGVIDRLGELKIHVNEFRGGMVDEVENTKIYSNLKTECFHNLEDAVARGNLLVKDKITKEQLLTVMYTHKSNGQRIIVPKEKMKTLGYKSPDDADALNMAFHAVRFANRRIEENEDFRTPINKQAPTGNLFKIAGYR
jgi:phage terminase large subunit